MKNRDKLFIRFLCLRIQYKGKKKLAIFERGVPVDIVLLIAIAVGAYYGMSCRRKKKKRV